MIRYSINVPVDHSTVYEEFHNQLSEAFATIDRVMKLINPPEAVTLTDWEGQQEYLIQTTTQQGETQ
jgi:hypothetical protein